MEEINRRIGTFFAVVGFVMLVLFFASDVQDQPRLSLLLLGSLSFFGGVYLIRRNRPQPKKPQRFRMMRRLMGSGDKPADTPNTNDNDINKDIDNEADETDE
ncbi:MAG TPA: hypothetical protein VJ965_00910 [Anaerolineales bacterium]|nr:hypothetical protein [Anaerolineales bacterium]